MGFDGVIEMSSDDARWDDYFSSASGKKKINRKVKYLARQIEKRKEKIKRLKRRADRNQAVIRKHETRLAQLESKLASYSKFDGDYSEARGGRRAVAQRKAEVRAAKREARKERKAVLKQERAEKRAMRRGRGRGMGNEMDMGDETDMGSDMESGTEMSSTAPAPSPMGMRRGMGMRMGRPTPMAMPTQMASPTPMAMPTPMSGRMGRMVSPAPTPVTTVEQSLNPNIGNNRIEIPAEEVGGGEYDSEESDSFNGTGLIGLDNQSDYDAPSSRKFDLKFSNADGTTKKRVDVKSVAIGVGVGVLAIMLAKKFIK
jgi:hypothetical protein